MTKDCQKQFTSRWETIFVNYQVKSRCRPHMQINSVPRLVEQNYDGLCWGTINTGIFEWCKMYPLTLPNIVLLIVPWPLLPVTISDAFTLLANSITPGPGQAEWVLLTVPFNC